MLLQLRLEDRNVATATALIGDTATADAATIATKGDTAVIAIEVITATAAPATTQTQLVITKTVATAIEQFNQQRNQQDTYLKHADAAASMQKLWPGLPQDAVVEHWPHQTVVQSAADAIIVKKYFVAGPELYLLLQQVPLNGVCVVNHC